MHGDTLCTKDTAYQEFRRRLRDTNWLAQFRAKPLVERKRLAAEFRFRSRLATQEKPEEITDVDPTAVAERMREHGVQRLIHGHTHRPALHRFELDGQSVERLVLGDWYRQGSLLTCTPQGCRLDGLGPGAIATVDGESCATN
jgi:UDP-2,3-diacylglucosamine hydrolase